MSLQARQAALSTAVARLLIENNEIEEQAAQRVQGIYDQVQRQVYWFLTATLLAIAATGLYLIRANRRLFAELASLSDGRRELAQQLIATRESTLRHLSRELHDEVGQILTAIGSMLGRAQKQTPADSPLRADLREIGEMAQGTLNNVRSLSQTLHPSILEELGLDSTFDWYLGTVEKQLGLAVSYERTGHDRARRRDDWHPRLPRAPGGAQQRLAPLGRRPRVGASELFRRRRSSSKWRIMVPGLRRGPGGAGWVWSRCASVPSLLAARSSSRGPPRAVRSFGSACRSRSWTARVGTKSTAPDRDTHDG